MSVVNRVSPLGLTELDSALLTGGYELLSAAGGIPAACFLIRIINSSTKDITVSYDGTHDHDYVPANSVAQLPFQTNSQPNNFAAFLAKGSNVYIKGTAGVGTIAFTGYYQLQNNS